MEFLPNIRITKRRSNHRKRSIKVLPSIGRNIAKMTTTIATTTIGLPKNKTGLFAADTLQEVKPAKNPPVTVPTLSSQHRHVGSSNTSEHTRSSKHGSSYHSDRNNGIMNETYLSINGIRDGFRPSLVRRQKFRIATAMARHDNNDQNLKDSSLKQTFSPSPASARLRSEIDQINSRLKIHRDLQKLLQSQNNNRDINDTPQSAFSYSTSCRLSSASTNPTTAHIQKRFSSVITNGTITTLASVETSNKSLQLLSGMGTPTSPINEEDNTRQDMTHAYQIPQQSNVGGESIFPVNSQTSPSIKSRSTKINSRSNGNKTVSCPFYVMYFTNLAIQQRDDNKTPLSMSPRSTSRKGTVTSRISTSYSRSQSSRKQVHSPISMNTYSTIDDDDSTLNSTSYYNNKRFSAKIAAFENENSHLLKDVLRTTSWNHLQV